MNNPYLGYPFLRGNHVPPPKDEERFGFLLPFLTGAVISAPFWYAIGNRPNQPQMVPIYAPIYSPTVQPNFPPPYPAPFPPPYPTPYPTPYYAPYQPPFRKPFRPW